MSGWGGIGEGVIAGFMVAGVVANQRPTLRMRIRMAVHDEFDHCGLVPPPVGASPHDTLARYLCALGPRACLTVLVIVAEARRQARPQSTTDATTEGNPT